MGNRHDAYVLCLLVVLSASAGCLGGTNLYEDKNTATIDKIPDELSGMEVTDVIHVDGDVFEDEKTERLLSTAIEESRRGDEEYDGPEDYNALLEMGGEDVHDLTEVNEIARISATEREDEFTLRRKEATIVSADWDFEEASESILPEVKEKREYKGVRINSAGSSVYGRMEVMAHIKEEDVFVISDIGVMEDIIDAHVGDAESLSGEMGEAVDGAVEEVSPVTFTRGSPTIFGVFLDADNIDGLRTGEVYYDDDGVVIETELEASSPREAEKVESTLLRSKSTITESDRAGDIYEKVNVTREQDTVTVRYESGMGTEEAEIVYPILSNERWEWG